MPGARTTTVDARAAPIAASAATRARPAAVVGAIAKSSSTHAPAAGA
jgi:hypothetical protein